MAQVTVYGHRRPLERRRTAISRAIHGAVVDALQVPADKRFHRFIGLDDEDFIHPADRGEDYLIIEISMFEGRSEGTKRELISQLFSRIQADVGLAPISVEITIIETPKGNWGIRGMNGADLDLSYPVEV